MLHIRKQLLFFLLIEMIILLTIMPMVMMMMVMSIKMMMIMMMAIKMMMIMMMTIMLCILPPSNFSTMHLGTQLHLVFTSPTSKTSLSPLILHSRTTENQYSNNNWNYCLAFAILCLCKPVFEY